jgi:hypothetical protein
MINKIFPAPSMYDLNHRILNEFMFTVEVEEQEGSLRKRKFRSRAHANPLADPQFEYPVNRKYSNLAKTTYLFQSFVLWHKEIFDPKAKSTAGES